MGLWSFCSVVSALTFPWSGMVCKSFDPSEPLFLLENGANINLSPGSLCKEKCADWKVNHKWVTGGASFFRQAWSFHLGPFAMVDIFSLDKWTPNLMNTIKIQARGKQARQKIAENRLVWECNNVKKDNFSPADRTSMLSWWQNDKHIVGGLALATCHHVISLLSMVCLTFYGFIVDQPHSVVIRDLGRLNRNFHMYIILRF